MADRLDTAADPNFQPIVIIQLMRIYDILLAILSLSDEAKAEKLAELHAKGIMFCPPPAWRPDVTDE